tara:strand:- start:284 stop:952 length:669 start_codon:yes stop_codon:yes gene_type:complete
MNRVVAIFAHPDDEILGCGGTLALHKKNMDKVDICIVSSGLKSREKNKISLDKLKLDCEEANKIIGVDSVTFFDFPDNALDSLSLLKIVKDIEIFLRQKKPNIIYTHHIGDLNVDHEIVHKAVLTASRPLPKSDVKEIYACEVNSSTEWSFNSKAFFSPTNFIDISKTIKMKIKALNTYKSELRSYPHPRSLEGVEILARYRGMQSGLEFAESFLTVRKISS